MAMPRRNAARMEKKSEALRINQRFLQRFGPDHRTAQQKDEAREVFSQWLRDLQAGKGTDFARLCSEHSNLAEDLEKFQAMFQLAQLLARSAGFQRSLREMFGEEAPVTLAL